MSGSPTAGGPKRRVRHLVLVLGDQLQLDAAAFDQFDRDQDLVLMVEARHEASYVPQHKQRLVLFFSAMRHFRDALRARGIDVAYAALDDDATCASLGHELQRRLRDVVADKVLLTQPGDHRVAEELRLAAAAAGTALEVRADRHFLCSAEDFAAFADGRKSLVMESFYRAMRRRHRVLWTEDDRPVGGRFNFDADNRQAFGKDGPPSIEPPRSFGPDDTTRAVMKLVDLHFPQAPGSTARFDLPVTHEQAHTALRDFVQHRLCGFGRYQDAMAHGHPYLYHSRLSTALNLHLLDPRDAIAAAVEAHDQGAAPLAAVEGFVRQILGWREFVRAIYWREMPDYESRNALDARNPLPAFLWTGDTDMACMRACVEQLLDHAYAHHIQRLMVLGLFCLLLGVDPTEVNLWHLAMYSDAIDQVSLPNVLGMSQYADGGLIATKPYCASGAYIARMSDYCSRCRYQPQRATGTDACPFTTLYWDFLARNRERLQGNRRMQFQLANLDRKSEADRRTIRRHASQLRDAVTGS